MSGPPILPMYKANAQKRRSTGPSKENVAIIIFSTFIAVFFFVSIYFGSKYLQDHIEVKDHLNYNTNTNTTQSMQNSFLSTILY